MAQPNARANGNTNSNKTGRDSPTNRTPRHRGENQTYSKPNKAACDSAVCAFYQAK